jgi:hypothetical protein
VQALVRHISHDTSRAAKDARHIDGQAYGELFAACYPDVLPCLRLLPDEGALEVALRVFLRAVDFGRCLSDRGLRHRLLVERFGV